MEAKKRKSAQERATEERLDRVRREAKEKHPDMDEVTFSWWGPELIVDVWAEGKHVGRYTDTVDDLDAALSRPGRGR